MLRSNCCGAKVKLVDKDNVYYECLKCHKKTDVYGVQRKAWEICPATKIKKDKKKDWSKLTKEEVEFYRTNEDF